MKTARRNLTIILTIVAGSCFALFCSGPGRPAVGEAGGGRRARSEVEAPDGGARGSSEGEIGSRFGWSFYVFELASWDCMNKEFSETIQYEQEVYARGKAASFWKTSKQVGGQEADPGLDALEAIEDAGFMREYVWTYLKRPGWNEPEGLRLKEFESWMRERLPDHRPVVDPGISMKLPGEQRESRYMDVDQEKLAGECISIATKNVSVGGKKEDGATSGLPIPKERRAVLPPSSVERSYACDSFLHRRMNVGISHFLPSEAEIEAANRAIMRFLVCASESEELSRIERDTAKELLDKLELYHLQYYGLRYRRIGVTKSERPFVVLNFFRVFERSNCREKCGAPSGAWRTELYSVKGGGTGFWSADYDIEKDRIDSVSINASR